MNITDLDLYSIEAKNGLRAQHLAHMFFNEVDEDFFLVDNRFGYRQIFVGVEYVNKYIDEGYNVLVKLNDNTLCGSLELIVEMKL